MKWVRSSTFPIVWIIMIVCLTLVTSNFKKTDFSQQMSQRTQIFPQFHVGKIITFWPSLVLPYYKTGRKYNLLLSILLRMKTSLSLLYFICTYIKKQGNTTTSEWRNDMLKLTTFHFSMVHGMCVLVRFLETFIHQVSSSILQMQ